MSNNPDPLSNPLNIQTIKEIDNLDLPIMQKHHVRILAHCLQILKIINIDNSFEYQNKNPLREWCDNQSKKFDDKKFSDLFYYQLESTSKKSVTANPSSLDEGKNGNICTVSIKSFKLSIKNSCKLFNDFFFSSYILSA